jgi:hypothetical protein
LVTNTILYRMFFHQLLLRRCTVIVPNNSTSDDQILGI